MKTFFQHDFNASQKDGLSSLIDAGGFEAYGRFWAFMELFYSMQINKDEYSETMRINERTLLKQLQMNRRSLPKLLQLFHETLAIVFQKFTETYGIVYETTVPKSLNYLNYRNKKKDNITININNKSNINSKKEKVEKTKTKHEEDFEIFWNSYPNKKGKDSAQKKWLKYKPELNIVLTALEWQKKSADWLKENGAFIPHGSTYVNQKRWEDEPAPNLFNTPVRKTPTWRPQ